MACDTHNKHLVGWHCGSGSAPGCSRRKGKWFQGMCRAETHLAIGALSRECGHEPRDSLKGNLGMVKGHSISHSLQSLAPAHGIEPTSAWRHAKVRAKMHAKIRTLSDNCQRKACRERHKAWFKPCCIATFLAAAAASSATCGKGPPIHSDCKSLAKLGTLF